MVAPISDYALEIYELCKLKVELAICNFFNYYHAYDKRHLKQVH